jgi:hypothetical protein
VKKFRITRLEIGCLVESITLQERIRTNVAGSQIVVEDWDWAAGHFDEDVLAWLAATIPSSEVYTFSHRTCVLLRTELDMLHFKLRWM